MNLLTDTLLAGIARRDITPQPGTLLMGYPDVRPGHEIADRLAATALVLQSGALTAAIVALDWGMIDEAEVAAIRALIVEATGIAPHNVTFCASHTHSAPAPVDCWGWVVKDHAYLDKVRPRIVAAVAAAQAALQPVKIGIGVGPTETGINRREVLPDGSVILGFNEWGPRDPDLTVVRFEGERGTVAQIVHLGAHPTSRGHDPAVSRDWPGVMLDRLEKVTGATTMFINGAFGDVAPRTTIGGGIGDGPVAAQEVGLRAANDAIRVWRGIKEFRAEPVQTLGGEMLLPFAPLAPLEEAQRQFAARAGQQDARGEPGCEWHYWNAVLQAHAAPPQDGRSFAQTLTRLGPLVIVPFAGEVFAETALRLKKASPFRHTLVAGTSNGCHGYYVTRESRGRGGYEVWVVRAFSAHILADNIDDVLVRENLRLLRQMNTG